MKRVLSVVLSVLLILSFGGASFAAAGDTGFSDVSADSWYADAAIYVRDNGIMSGVSETEFSPDDTMTRAMLTTVLYRMAQSPAVTGDDSFTDTAPGEWYSSAVIWALDRGIVGGYGDGTFGTNDPISREQFATILWRYAGEPQTGSGTGAFADAGDISDYARSAADWAYSAGIMRGDEAGRFNPAAYATRAEAAVILYNYLNTDPAAAPTEPVATPATEPASGSDTNILVVYYSATGNTEEAANYIAAAANADIFELTPVEPYTSDDLNWTDENSRVVYEHDNPDAREVELVSTTVPNWDSYDAVFIGYPIWWGIAAWPVDGFVEANDFTGKTVIPFCTSSSSGLGDSGRLLEELAGTGNWLEGRRFSSRLTAADAEEWIAELGL